MTLTPQITEYTIDPFPEDRNNSHHWRVKAQRHRDHSWVIYNGGFWLHADGSWWPSNSTAQRFPDLAEALEQAEAAIRRHDVNGTTWADMCERWGAR